MIQPEELRIGNFINYSDYGPSVITKVDGDGFCSFVPYRWSGDIGKMLSEIEPIPLTEEWLIKFGFTIEHTIGGYLKWEIRTTKGRIIKLLDKKFTWGTGEYSDYILFVHQLQNLYFCLTGEELTIYEPTKQQ